MADRIIQVKSGQILSNKVNEHPVPVEQIEWCPLCRKAIVKISGVISGAT